MRSRGSGVAFVVRTPGRWRLAPLPAGQPLDADVEDVLELMRTTVDAAFELTPERAQPTAAPLGPDDLVGPSWAWVAAVLPGHLLIENAQGEHLLIDEDAVRLLDALGPEPRTLGELVADRSDGTDRSPTIAQLIATLAEVGCIRVWPRASRTSPPSPAAEQPESPPMPPMVDPSVGAGRTPTFRTLARGLARRGRDALRRQADRRRSSPASPAASAAGELPGTPAEPRVEVAPPTPPEPREPTEADAPPIATADDRVPVYAVWHEQVGPMLALGMLTAYARIHEGGALTDRYEIRRPERADLALEDLARRTGPAVLLCSDYIWSIEENLDLARRAREICPELVIVHGGPSCPKYAQDAEQFLREHTGLADILVRGEGEITLAELLMQLDPHEPNLPMDRLVDVPGLTFIDPSSGQAIRTADRERVADLDMLPSPYLTGEFDHIPAEVWAGFFSIETNRGCPYGCTFCDWGSATLSRIRKFDLDRVMAELEWAAGRGVDALNITDANFGIMSRDVEFAERIAELKHRTGRPNVVVFYTAKNTTKHLVKIMDLLVDAGITSLSALSLQTTDPATLEAIQRSNISTDHYVNMAAQYRRRGHPLESDLMLGLPGQTYDSYRRDLQFHFDHEIMARTWPVRILPNSPMNDPEYRARWEIEEDEFTRVMSTSTFSREDRERMLRFRNVEIITERFGLLRHPLRYLQWDHGLPATDVMERARVVAEDEPLRYPALAWVLGYFDLLPTVAVGWQTFYDDFASFMGDEFGIDRDAAFDTVLALQRFLMPSPGRTFPATIELRNDYLTYYRDATESLYTTGHAGTPPRPLSEYGPASFTVTGDPLHLCDHGLELRGDARDPMFEGDFIIGGNCGYELESPLLRLIPWVSCEGIEPPYRGPSSHQVPDPPPATDRIPLEIRRRAS